MNISISQLEKQVNKLKTELEAKGFKVEIDVFSSGNNSGRPSYVEIDISDSVEDFWLSKQFLANGYSASTARQISTENGWKIAKQEIILRLPTI